MLLTLQFKGFKCLNAIFLIQILDIVMSRQLLYFSQVQFVLNITILYLKQ